jgi:ribosomal protein S18 acetylase RimI-like enzyme
MQRSTVARVPRLRFVRVRLKDAARFVALEREIETPKLYAPALTIAAAKAEIRRNRLYFLCCGARRVGTIAYRVRDDGSVEISNLAIRPAWRRRGLARAAMAFVFARNRAPGPFELVTHPENRKALRLYAGLGFEIRRRIENCFGDGEPRLVLVKNL